MGWRPMETAPKDGTEILILFTDGRVRSCSWVERRPIFGQMQTYYTGWFSKSPYDGPIRAWGIAWTAYSEEKAAVLEPLTFDALAFRTI